MEHRSEPTPVRRRVLVVDDEAGMRKILRKSLAALGGYAVWEGGRAEEALGRLASADLLVTDISMPGMGGLALIRRARDEHPALAILAVSADPANRGPALGAGADVFLAKPLRPSTIVEAAGLLLAGRGGREEDQPSESDP
ncbi:MAG: response regulator [Deferrisomatales bacterium]|nr:response regulator [Deferrisomatales bacterium]